jgi:hypothetical protein
MTRLLPILEWQQIGPDSKYFGGIVSYFVWWSHNHGRWFVSTNGHASVTLPQNWDLI